MTRPALLNDEEPDMSVWLTPHKYQSQARNYDFPNNPWHYTSLTGLEGILSSHVVWATESRELNDPSEITHAISSLIGTWEKTRHSLVPEAPKAEVDTWLKSMERQLSKRRFYFVSASLEGDKLQHWQSYAGGDGFAVELERNAEFRLVGTPQIYRPGFAPNPWWRRVTYGSYENGVSPRGGSLFHGRDGIMEQILNEFAAFRRGHRPDEEAFWEHLEALFWSSVCFHKHHGYMEEEEVRLVFLEPPVDGFVHGRSSRYTSEGNTSFLKIAADSANPFSYSVERGPKLPIVSVRVGPRSVAAASSEIDRVKQLLRENGYDDVEVSVSAIPFRK